MLNLLRTAAVVAVLSLVPRTTLAVPQNCIDPTSLPVQLRSWPISGEPLGLATDGEYVFATDAVSHQVCRYSLFGSDVMCWGALGTQPGEFNEPRWIGVGPNTGFVYVANQSSFRVQAFDNGGNLLFQLAEAVGVAAGEFAGDFHPFTIHPQTGDVYVHDFGTVVDSTVNRIHRFDENGNLIDLFGDYSSGGSCWVQIHDMAFSPSGALYLLTEFQNLGGWRVRKLDAAGNCAAAWGVPGPAPGQLLDPTDMAFDEDGFLYVVDVTRIQKFDSTGTFLGAIDAAPATNFTSVCVTEGQNPHIYAGVFGSPTEVALFGAAFSALNVLGDDSQWIDESFQFISNDLELLAVCDTVNHPEMKGVAADGVSTLLLRWRLPYDGTVRWSISDPDNPGETFGQGYVEALGGSPNPQMVNVNVEAVDDEWIAYGYYTSPIDFDRAGVPGDNTLGSRSLRLTARFVASGSADTLEVEQDMVIERPPVVFVHGLWSNKKAWSGFKSIIKDPSWSGKASTVDYSLTHGRPHLENVDRLRDKIGEELGRLRRHVGTSAAQVDVVAHSMGGTIARTYADGDDFFRKSNAGWGDYHKVLFLDVPHEGSPLASGVVKLRTIMENPGLYGLLNSLSARLKLSLGARLFGTEVNQIIGGAAEDLSEGSAAVTSFGQVNTAIHAHVGVGGKDEILGGFIPLYAIKNEMAALFLILTDFTLIPEVGSLLFSPNDVAVLEQSQIGGLTNPNHYHTVGDIDGLHWEATKSDTSGAIALQWALSSVYDGSFFSPSIPASSASATSPTRTPAQVQNEVLPYAGVQLRFVSPTDGATLSPGQNIIVEIEEIPSVMSAGLDKAVVVYEGGLRFMEEDVFGTPFTVPLDAVGPFVFSAMALRLDSTIVRSDPITVTIDPSPATIDSITVDPDDVILTNRGSTRQLRVIGHYSDAQDRDVESGALGTTYSGFAAGVIEVTADGLVYAVSPGVTALDVSNGSSMKTVSVEVLDGAFVNNAPHAIAGGPYEVCNGGVVLLDGSGSFDLDENVVATPQYSWDLDMDGQFDDASGDSPLVTMTSFIGDEALIALRAVDPAGAESFDYTTVIAPLSCFTGVFACSTDAAPVNTIDDVGFDAAGNFYVLSSTLVDGFVDKYDGSCGLTLTYQLPGDRSHFAVDGTGTAHAFNQSSAEVERFSSTGLQLASISVAPLSPDGAIAVDPYGNIYGNEFDPDSNATFIVQFAPDGTRTNSWNLTAATGQFGARSLAADSAQSVYMIVFDAVYKIRLDAGNYVLDTSWGNSGTLPGEFDTPNDIAVGPGGHVFVADQENHRIQRFLGDGTYHSLRKSGDAPGGRFDDPKAVAVDASGRIVVADYPGTNRVHTFFWDTMPVGITEPPGDGTNGGTPHRPDNIVLYPPEYRPGATGATIRFWFEKDVSTVVLRVYDVRGRLVRLFSDLDTQLGDHAVQWDGRDNRGTQVASGVYLIQLTADARTKTSKVLIVK